jgi:hypothetical protein
MRNAYPIGMRRTLPLLLCLAAWVAPLPGATLRQLSLDDLIQKSSDIVRVKVLSSYGELRGKVIYTHWNLQVMERWKGSEQAGVDVLVPGGSAAGLHQSVPGAPQLVAGQDYLLFLWTSKSGAIYLTGWGQGVFSLSRNATGDLMASRAPAAETMLDAVTWLPVQDEGLQMRYADITAQIAATLAAGSGQ